MCHTRGVTILIGLFGGVLGAIVGGIMTRSSMVLGLKHDYDKTLRDIRLKSYQQLFYLSRQIPRHWLLTPEPSRAELMKIRTSFHDWYYAPDAAGMFLAKGSKAAYIALMDALDAALFERESRDSDTKVRDRPDSKLSEAESHQLLVLSSHLRHQLAADVGAANAPRIRSDSPARTVLPLPLASNDPSVTVADTTA